MGFPHKWPVMRRFYAMTSSWYTCIRCHRNVNQTHVRYISWYIWIFFHINFSHRMQVFHEILSVYVSQIANSMGPTRGPHRSCRPQMGPMLAPWTLLSGIPYCGHIHLRTEHLFLGLYPVWLLLRCKAWPQYKTINDVTWQTLPLNLL